MVTEVLEQRQRIQVMQRTAFDYEHLAAVHTPAPYQKVGVSCQNVGVSCRKTGVQTAVAVSVYIRKSSFVPISESGCRKGPSKQIWVFRRQ